MPRVRVRGSDLRWQGSPPHDDEGQGWGSGLEINRWICQERMACSSLQGRPFREAVRRAGWRGGVPGGGAACRVAGRRAGWQGGVPGGGAACRVAERQARWRGGAGWRGGGVPDGGGTFVEGWGTHGLGALPPRLFCAVVMLFSRTLPLSWSGVAQAPVCADTSVRRRSVVVRSFGAVVVECCDGMVV
jgi:hypothetical protein